jgi:hypothetical protein
MFVDFWIVGFCAPEMLKNGQKGVVLVGKSMVFGGLGMGFWA